MQHKYRSSMELRNRDGGESSHFEENTAWAVSYADLLMVLLSFFVIFYSANGDKGEGVNLLTEVSSAFRKIDQPTQNDLAHKEVVQNAGSVQGQNQLTSDNTAAKPPSQSETYKGVDTSGFSNALRDVIIRGLAGIQVSVAADEWKNSLVVNLPEDIFAIGKFELSSENVEGLTKILETLKPFASKIEIIFIGHADSTVFRNIGGRIVKDNFALSSLRANSALQIARGIGFSDEQLFAQGAAANFQKSRTISLKIQELKNK